MWLSDGGLNLSIHDDGRGFDVGEIRLRALEGKSFGLTSMQERASLAGGRIEITSTPGQGATIHAWFSL
jgi:signal transduction histidine kinase